MSEMDGKSTDCKDTSVSNNKYSDSGQQSGRTYRRNNYQRGGRDRQANEFSRDHVPEFKRNRGSYRGGSRNNNFDRKPFKRTWSNSQQGGKRKKLEVGNRLKECDVSITEFIGDQGFSGVIKERYTDFHVNEIDIDGQIAKLTNQDIPSVGEEEENVEDLKKLVSDAVWDQLQTLKESGSASIEIDVTELDKQQRRAIHAIAKSITNVVSQTVDRETKKIMVILRNDKDNSKSHNFRKDNRVDWKTRGGEYCYFLLHKVNMDTMDALNQLAMNLRMKPNNFNYAGTKDRRAWTTQWVSLRKVLPSHILRAAKSVRGAYVGNFKFAKEPLKLGMLNGNHFRIALRNVSGTDDQIESVMTSLRDNGFINYYGLQRFGTVASIPTYEIGKALLQGKWNEAIELILKPREGEQDEDLAEARTIYETTKDAYAAYKKIKRPDKIEATLLKGIYTSGSNNPQGALDLLPRNARLMYIHAYQSLVWNYMVSKRIKEFGRAPIVGDLVYDCSVKQQDIDSDDFTYENENESVEKDSTDDKDQDIESTDKICKLASETESCTDTTQTPETSKVLKDAASTCIKQVTDLTECCLKMDESAEHRSVRNGKENNEDLHTLPAVKVLTQDDLANYSLADIIMPQVGWKVTYPPYAKPWFDEFLAKDGLTTDLRQKNKKYSLGGAYRQILQIPSSLSWTIMRYKEKHSNLIMCDIDEMRELSSPKDEPDGPYKALIVEMSLKSSTYATMALREILKLDTSPQAQAAQSAACEAEMENTKDSNAAESKTDCESTCTTQIDNTISDKTKSLETEVTEQDTTNTISDDAEANEAV